ncbi:MAG: hypothetical protein EOP32_11970 [Rhodococcus sp. (in: high G+C Gram-positive bacteria)]|nr:MAG: hypothetical protein EOP32_11970 [Rhodococcus sp. (in: high G+C Gram-positive bacteria)]
MISTTLNTNIVTTTNGTVISLDRDGDLIGITITGTDAAEGHTELQISAGSLRELLDRDHLEDILGTPRPRYAHIADRASQAIHAAGFTITDVASWLGLTALETDDKLTGSVELLPTEAATIADRCGQQASDWYAEIGI